MSKVPGAHSLPNSQLWPQMSPFMFLDHTRHTQGLVMTVLKKITPHD